MVLLGLLEVLVTVAVPMLLAVGMALRGMVASSASAAASSAGAGIGSSAAASAKAKAPLSPAEQAELDGKLLYAVWAGDHEDVPGLLDQGASPNAVGRPPKPHPGEPENEPAAETSVFTMSCRLIMETAYNLWNHLNRPARHALCGLLLLKAGATAQPCDRFYVACGMGRMSVLSGLGSADNLRPVESLLLAIGRAGVPATYVHSDPIGVDLNTHGQTSLMVCIEYGLNGPVHKGKCPVATTWEDFAIAEVKAGAQVNGPMMPENGRAGYHGKTMLQVAREKGMARLVAAMEAKGAVQGQA